MPDITWTISTSNTTLVYKVQSPPAITQIPPNVTYGRGVGWKLGDTKGTVMLDNDTCSIYTSPRDDAITFGKCIHFQH